MCCWGRRQTNVRNHIGWLDLIESSQGTLLGGHDPHREPQRVPTSHSSYARLGGCSLHHTPASLQELPGSPERPGRLRVGEAWGAELDTHMGDHGSDSCITAAPVVQQVLGQDSHPRRRASKRFEQRVGSLPPAVASSPCSPWAGAGGRECRVGEIALASFGRGGEGNSNQEALGLRGVSVCGQTGAECGTCEHQPLVPGHHPGRTACCWMWGAGAGPSIGDECTLGEPDREQPSGCWASPGGGVPAPSPHLGVWGQRPPIPTSLLFSLAWEGGRGYISPPGCKCTGMRARMYAHKIYLEQGI